MPLMRIWPSLDVDLVAVMTTAAWPGPSTHRSSGHQDLDVWVASKQPWPVSKTLTSISPCQYCCCSVAHCGLCLKNSLLLQWRRQRQLQLPQLGQQVLLQPQQHPAILWRTCWSQLPA